MGALDAETGIIFESVIFPDRHVEVSFTEANDRGEGIARVQTIVLDGPERCTKEWNALVEALVDLVDGARLALRDPPETISVVRG